MDHPNHPNGVPPEDQTSSPFQKRWRRRSARVTNFRLRDLWWRLLDYLETRHALRRSLYAALALLVVIGAAWAWAYPWWMRRNALSIARQWMAAGRYDYASETLKQALADSPERPEVWRLAAELARRRRSLAEAVDYSHHAATLDPENTEFTLQWAEDALLAEQPDTAEQALATLPAARLAGSSHAQRLAGEIARRRVELTAARTHFETALRFDGPVAIDEVPLGSILIFSRDPVERQHGLALLAKWAPDREWGATALRPLLGDALDHDDRAAMLKWGETLRAHPHCTLADIPNCLLALSRADSAKFAEVLAILEKNQAVNSSQIALLVSWLNQIGRGAEAVRWVQQLPPALTGKPPVVVVAAEAFRQASDWTGLNAWVAGGDWGRDVEFIRLAYGMQAARQLGNKARADELWQTLQGETQANGVHALFAADTFYTWGWPDEAAILLWKVADQPGVALPALGTLARHYQMQRDAEGQFRTFRRLHAVRAQDASIANDFAFFAALTANESASAEQIALANHKRAPGNLAYLSTYAFVLLMQNRANDALALLQPAAGDWQKSPGLAFAYGLTLAATGRKDEARPLLTSLDLATLTTREEELVRAALN
jgi:predicted Zn-dependent protease